jgi:hypothetical protein
MKINCFFLLVVTLLFVACEKHSAVISKLSGCDSLVITFNLANGDSVINRVETTNKNAIEKLKNFLIGKQTRQKQCGFDGNMVFFNNGEPVLPVSFQYSIDTCRRFFYSLDNKTFSTKMSNEAVDFFKSLSENRSWY